MLFAIENSKSFHSFGAKFVIVEHAVNGELDNFRGVVFHLPFERNFFSAFRVAGVGEINFLFSFFPGYFDFAGIGNDYEI